MGKNSSEKQSNSQLLSLVLGYLAVKDLDAIEEKVKVLSRLGYKNEEMALICGTTSGTIRTAKYQIKKPSKKSK